MASSLRNRCAKKRWFGERWAGFCGTVRRRRAFLVRVAPVGCTQVIRRKQLGETMDWEQIESKWQAMARRIRADLKDAKAPLPRAAGGDASSASDGTRDSRAGVAA
jgi:hypothetical protein